MTKDLTAAEKGRKTRLSKMTNEELINIILRKDETEHKYSNINKCLKENVIGLENKIKTLQANITELEDRLVVNDNNNEDLRKDLEAVTKDNENYKAEQSRMLHTINLRKRDLRRLVWIIIALGFANIIQGIISLI